MATGGHSSPSDSSHLIDEKELEATATSPSFSESPPSSMDESTDESIPKGCGVGLFGVVTDVTPPTDPKVSDDDDTPKVWFELLTFRICQYLFLLLV